jgi:polyisoprenoid-binding protein YceI
MGRRREWAFRGVADVNRKRFDIQQPAGQHGRNQLRFPGGCLIRRFFAPAAAPFVAQGVPAAPGKKDAAFFGAGKMPAQMGGSKNVGFEATTTIKRSDFAWA